MKEQIQRRIARAIKGILSGRPHAPEIDDYTLDRLYKLVIIYRAISRGEIDPGSLPDPEYLDGQ